MPLLLICGRPCSGKSTITSQVASTFQQAGCEVIIVDEPTAHIDKNAGHQGAAHPQHASAAAQQTPHTDAHAEKTTRGLLRAATHRALQRPNAVVLLDYMCGIKGYRYELWCMARERATRCALLHCTVPRDAVDAWRLGTSPETPNTTQTDAPTTYVPHQQHVFDDLWQRFEVPDTRNRWDRPLIEVDPRDADATHTGMAAAVVALLGTAIPGTTDALRVSDVDQTPVVEAMQAMTLKPTVATSRQLPTDTMRRTMIDRATQAVVQRVMDAQVGYACTVWRCPGYNGCWTAAVVSLGVCCEVKVTVSMPMCAFVCAVCCLRVV